MMKVFLGLLVTLTLGGYIYSWSLSSGAEQEKRDWRQEHNRVLAEQFQQLNDERRHLNEKIEQNQEKIQRQLQEQNQKLNDVLIEFMQRDMERERRGDASRHGR
jgi:uncharacterized protein HemX